VGFGVVFGVVFGFGLFFWFILVWFATVQLLNSYCFAREGWWGWFPGVFRVPSGVWRVFRGWVCFSLSLCGRAEKCRQVYAGSDFVVNL
jgi:hypothetical protein